ncbi:MAG: hypothetical protein ABIV13_00805 [Fimbriimonadales bacterium]
MSSESAAFAWASVRNALARLYAHDKIRFAGAHGNKRFYTALPPEDTQNQINEP